MARRGRPRLLDPALAERLTAFAEAGLSVEDAASAAGASPRSVRRWRAEGEREIAELSPEARVALAFERAQPQPPTEPTTGWQASAAFLAEAYPERWSVSS